MSGIDPNRDTQGEIEIIGATILLAPLMHRSMQTMSNLQTHQTEVLNFIALQVRIMTIEMHVMEYKSGTAKMKQAKILIPAKDD